jgi:hypothetical protein
MTRGACQQGQGALDQQFGFRPRHQHRSAHRKFQRPELALPGEVGQRLALGTPAQQVQKALGRRGADGPLGCASSPRAAPAEGARQQAASLSRIALERMGSPAAANRRAPRAIRGGDSGFGRHMP